MVYSYGEKELREKLPKRRADSHKGSYGKVLVVAGSRNMCGAAYLCAKAAYRTGAGLVYIYTEECNRVILQQLLPEAVLCTYEEDRWEAEPLRAAFDGKSAIVAGPGLGTSEVKRRILAEVLCQNEVPRILDADALNLLSASPKLWQNVKAPLIVTPHRKEMERLGSVSLEQLAKEPQAAAMEYARSRGVITVLKGAHTVVSDGVDCYVNLSGNHGMATGGSGDVLSGIIGGLLAQKLDLFEAAKLGVYIHGLAGDAACSALGAYHMMAGDLLDYILLGIS